MFFSPTTLICCCFVVNESGAPMSTLQMLTNVVVSACSDPLALYVCDDLPVFMFDCNYRSELAVLHAFAID